MGGNELWRAARGLIGTIRGVPFSSRYHGSPAQFGLLQGLQVG